MFSKDVRKGIWKHVNLQTLSRCITRWIVKCCTMPIQAVVACVHFFQHLLWAGMIFHIFGAGAQFGTLWQNPALSSLSMAAV